MHLFTLEYFNLKGFQQCMNTVFTNCLHTFMESLHIFPKFYTKPQTLKAKSYKYLAKANCIQQTCPFPKCLKIIIILYKLYIQSPKPIHHRKHSAFLDFQNTYDV